MGIESNELYMYMEKDEEFKKLVVGLLGDIDNFYCEEVYDKYKRVGEVIDELGIDNLSDDVKEDMIIIKERIDDYNVVYNDFKLHKPILKSLGLLK